MAYRNLEIAHRGAVRTITVNRPDKLNALNRDTLNELTIAFAQAAQDDDVRAVVLAGAGDKAFVAGADIAELATQGPFDGRARARAGQRVLSRIERSPKPVIAAVNGFALGGGCELALACHIRIASSAAKFALPEVKLGIGPGYGGTQRLPRLVGTGRALQILLTGDTIDAAEALRIGLVNAVVRAEELLDVSRMMLGRMIANGPLAVAHCIDAVQRGSDVALDEALALETSKFGLLAASADMQEGTAAFLEKRAAQFTGR
jgi:enoyl-CoA hydratase